MFIEVDKTSADIFGILRSFTKISWKVEMWSVVLRRVARGVNGDNALPPITKSCTKKFQVNQAFDIEAKRYVSANQLSTACGTSPVLEL